MSGAPSLVVGVRAAAAGPLRASSSGTPYSGFFKLLDTFGISNTSLVWDPPSGEDIQYVHLPLPDGVEPLKIQEKLLELPFVAAAYVKPPGESPVAEGPPG